MRRHIYLGIWLTMSVVLVSCQRSTDDPSVEAGRSPVDENVENGTAYDQATVDMIGVKKVALPHDARVQRSDDSETLRLYLGKTLAFAGHPGKKMSIRQGRKNMGCAM